MLERNLQQHHLHNYHNERLHQQAAIEPGARPVKDSVTIVFVSREPGKARMVLRSNEHSRVAEPRSVPEK